MTTLPPRARMGILRIVPNRSQKFQTARSSSRLNAAHGADDLLGYLVRFDDGGAQALLPLAGLMAVQVPLAGLLAEQLAVGGNAEPLLGAFVGFLLWHRIVHKKKEAGGRRTAPGERGTVGPDIVQRVRGAAAPILHLRGQERRHLLAFHTRRLFNLGELGELLDQVHHDLAAFVDMLQLAAPEADTDKNLVVLLQELL